MSRNSLLAVGCIYNVNETSAFSIVKVPMFNNENKHGTREPSWYCQPTSKFALCGDIEYRHHILPLCRFLDIHCRHSYRDEVKHWKSGEIYFKSLLVCLKTVKIFGFGERFFCTTEAFILVVQFLLKNAKVLEKMVIIASRDMQNQKRLVLPEFLQVTQKLLSFPRSSPHAVVLFPYL
ncbi:hypothetical protein CFP56_026279 [Quercus suber]|uniref:FBD domain-containing protein n=1 Tax=Quercus suber TaxID=58331 RepID=A0AAW0K2Q8_QUESU